MQTERTEDSKTLLEHLYAYAKIREKEGIFPYECQWLTLDEINNQISRKKDNDRIQLLKVGLLFAMVYAVAGLSLLFIYKFGY